jgi:peptidoglycan/xylan/chitin deacetylase (PgdA/CDA1 family)
MSLSGRSRHAAFLCYHSIADDGPSFLSLPAETFERQLALLRRDGWRTGTSEQLRELANGTLLGRTAFLTFDDGFADNHDAALPLLRSYGACAVIFALPPLLDAGGPLAWPEVTERQQRHPGVMRSLTWERLDTMVEAGVEVGSHGLTHAHFDRLGAEELREELFESRRRIADRYGACRLLAYPFGHWSPAVADAAADAGYEFAFTMPRGGQWHATRFSIPRIPVDQRDDERNFRLKLSATGRTLLLSPLRAPARRARRTVRSHG